MSKSTLQKLERHEHRCPRGAMTAYPDWRLRTYHPIGSEIRSPGLGKASFTRMRLVGGGFRLDTFRAGSR